MMITWDTIITTASVISAIVVIVKYYNKAHAWIDRQNEQEEELRSVKNEQTLLVRGILACLKGLKEQGCNGPVTEAIDEIEKHLNKEAHK